MSTVRRDPRADDPAYDGITGYRTMAQVEADPPQFTGIQAEAGAEADLPVPAVGDRYVSTDPRDAGRIVTITRVWTAEDDEHPAVACEWGDRGQCGTAMPLCVFLRSYRPEADPDAGLSPVLRNLRDAFLTMPTGDRPATAEGALCAARMLLAAHARELADAQETRAREIGRDMRERGDRRRVPYCGGMDTVLKGLHRYADDLDAAAVDGDQ